MIIKTKPLVVGVMSIVVLTVLIVLAIVKQPATNDTPPSAPSDDSQSAAPPTTGEPAPAATPTPPASAGPTPTTKPSAKPTPAPLPAPAPSISFTAPASGEKWVFSKNNTVQWSKEVGFAGEVYLVSASDKSVVGWILTETGIRQTSYAWNTRDVYVSKTNPSKKTVSPGDYIIKAAFSTNPKIEFTSAPFSIIYENEVYVPNYILTIKDYAFLLPSLTVKKGDKITFTNGDPVAHTLNLSSYSPFVIQPGASFTFDTSVLTQGPYNFYSTTYPTLKLTVTVQ